MRALAVLTAALGLAACQASPASSASPAPILAPSGPGAMAAAGGTGGSHLELVVERLWSEDGEAFASIRVRNVASYELVKITVECSAIDPAGPTAKTARETLLAPSEAPLRPGSERSARISFGRCGSVESMTCTARAL